MNVSTTDSAIYLFELQPPFERLEFQFVPQELIWERTPNIVRVPIVGRNNSRKHLTGGEDKLSFTLDFNSLFETDKQQCVKKLAWLQSLAVMDGFSGPPRNVKLAWGLSDMFRHKVWIVTRVGGKMSEFNSLFGYSPTQLYVDIEMELDPVENTRLSDVHIFDLNNRPTAVRSINDFVNPNIA